MIEWPRVVELREEVGDESLEEVVELFLEEVEGTLGALSPGMDRASIEEGAHFLKGAALNLGFARFAELCAEIEVASRTEDCAPASFEKLHVCYAASKAQFLAEFRDRIAA